MKSEFDANKYLAAEADRAAQWVQIRRPAARRVAVRKSLISLRDCLIIAAVVAIPFAIYFWRM